MADGVDVRQLLLEVDASTELLRNGLLKAARNVQDFQQQANTSLKAVDADFAKLNTTTGFNRSQLLELTHVGKSLFDQLAAGQSPIRALSLEGGRLAQIVQGSGGIVPAFKGLIELIGGPTTLAFVALTGVIAAAGFAFDKYAYAEESAADASKRLEEAQHDLEDATKRLHQTVQQEIADSREATQATLDRAYATRLLLKARLEDAQAQAKAFSGSANEEASVPETGGFGVSGLTAGIAQSRAAAIQSALNLNAVEIGTLKVTKRVDDFSTSLDKTTLKLDPAAAATARFTQKLNELRDAAAKGSISTDQRDAGIRQAFATRDATLDAIKAAESAGKRATSEISKAAREAANAAKKAAEEARKELEKLYELQFKNSKLIDGLGGSTSITEIRAQEDKARAKDRQDSGLGDIVDSIDSKRLLTSATPFLDILKKSQEFSAQLAHNIGLAVVNGQSLGGALVNSLKAAAAEAISSGIFKILLGAGSGGGFAGLFSKATSFFSGLGFANGGSPPVGQASLIGERGPELFVPSTPGVIFPNGSFGGGGGSRPQAVAVTVDVNPSPLFVVATQVAAAQAGQQAASEAARRQSRPGLAGGRG